MFPIILAIAGLGAALPTTSAYAQDGTLDTNFAHIGGPVSYQETASVLATQFGRVVAAGTARYLDNKVSYVPFLARLNVDRIFYSGFEPVP